MVRHRVPVPVVPETVQLDKLVGRRLGFAATEGARELMVVVLLVVLVGEWRGRKHDRCRFFGMFAHWQGSSMRLLQVADNVSVGVDVVCALHVSGELVGVA